MTFDKNSMGSGRHRRRRTDSGPVTGSFIPGKINGDFTGDINVSGKNSPFNFHRIVEDISEDVSSSSESISIDNSTPSSEFSEPIVDAEETVSGDNYRKPEPSEECEEKVSGEHNFSSYNGTNDFSTYTDFSDQRTYSSGRNFQTDSSLEDFMSANFSSTFSQSYDSVISSENVESFFQEESNTTINENKIVEEIVTDNFPSQPPMAEDAISKDEKLFVSSAELANSLLDDRGFHDSSLQNIISQRSTVPSDSLTPSSAYEMLFSKVVPSVQPKETEDDLSVTAVISQTRDKDHVPMVFDPKSLESEQTPNNQIRGNSTDYSFSSPPQFPFLSEEDSSLPQPNSTELFSTDSTIIPSQELAVITESTPLTETGRHRIMHKRSKRGVAAWPIITTIMILIIVLTVIGWQLVSNRVSDKHIHDLADCPTTKATTVYVSPFMVDYIKPLIAQYNGNKPKQGDFCYVYHVETLDSREALTKSDLLTTDTSEPRIWIPESSIYTSALKAKNPKLVMGQSTSLASSPVVLALQPIDAYKLRQLHWSDLPAAQKDQGLAPYGITSWLSLKLALPQIRDSVATDLTVGAVAASVPDPKTTLIPLLNDDLLHGNVFTSRVSNEVNALYSSAPRLSSRLTSMSQILNLLAHQDPEKVNQFHAVPVLESQLYNYVLAHPRARLQELIPAGFTVIADFPAQIIADSTTDQEALNSFVEYVTHSSAFRQSLAKHGLRDPQLTPFTSAIDSRKTIVRIESIGPAVFPTDQTPKASAALLGSIKYNN